MLTFDANSLCVTIAGVSAPTRSNDARANWADYRCEALYGVFLSSERLVVGDGNTGVDISVDEALGANGEWLAIFKDDTTGDYLVLTDAFALQSLYYGSVENDGVPTLILGSNPQVVAYERNRRGQAIEPDWGLIASWLSSVEPFASTISSDDTPDLNMKTMRPFEMMHISGGAATIVPRADVVRLREKSYDELLDEGIAAALAQFRTLHNIDFGERRINLSGGKDSRVMMAMLSKMDLIPQYTVTTVNPDTWHSKSGRKGLIADLKIADAMRRKYGMTWTTAPDTVVDHVSLRETINNWQHFNSGLNFRFGLQTRWMLREPLHLELRGAHGAAFRAYWSKTWHKVGISEAFGNTPESFEADTQVIADYLYKPGVIEPAAEKLRFATLLGSLRATRKDDVQSASDSHFTLYRNRGHFGHILSFLQGGAFPFFPLGQTHFVLAAQKIERDVRVLGAVLFDIVERLEPSLNDLEFDDGLWPDALWKRAGRRPETEWDVVDDYHDIEGYFERHEHNSAVLAEARKSARPAVIASNQSFARAYIRGLFDELRYLPGSEDVMTETLAGWLIRVTERNMTRARVQVSKLLSIRDAVIGTPAKTTRRFGEEPATPIEQLESLTFTNLPVPRGIRRHTAVPLVRLDASRTGNRVNVRALVDQSQRHDLEFAFYLHQGDDVVGKTGYSPLPFAEFTYRGSEPVFVKGFARYAFRPGQIFSFVSTVLE